MLTVVIPSYNHEHYVRDCLAAACKINVQYLKILVIDDGSTDGTVDVVNNFMAANRSVSIELIEKPNSGLVSSLNLALSLVQTELMYLVASDDIPVHKGIEFCVARLISDQELQFIIGGAENLFSDGSFDNVYRNSHLSFFNLSDQEKHKKIFIDYPKPLLLQSSVFRTIALKSVGGWDENIILDDYAIFIKLLTNYSGDRGHYLFNSSICVVKYRQHAGNSSKNYTRQYLMVRQVINKYAPLSLRNKAIGYRLGFYIMLCLRNRMYLELKKIISESSFAHIAWAVIIIPVYLFKYITSKL